ncbi:MAG: alpha/beta hydrolase, partial [Acetobacteraceae bacterium]|nr:alpha/beta hydrolase [Acetobacteraceae bacterium]
VVLLHGVPQTSYEWRHIIPVLARLYSVISPDLRGLGETSRPAGGFDKRTIAADVWSLVHTHLGHTRFFVAGHDWGGPVAFSLAAQHPDAVRRLAILDVVIPGDGGDFSQGGRRWHHALFQTLDLPEALFADRAELLLTWFFDTYGYIPNSVTEEDKREYLRTYSKPGALRSMFGFYRALAQDAADNLALLGGGKLKMPVLALGGDRSFGRGMEPLESLRRVAEDVRGGLIPNCGHWVAEEQPAFVADQLIRFFGEDPEL